MTLKILWVDDDHNNHFDIISESGDYDIVQAMDPHQAVEKLALADYDFVIVDILFRYAPWDLPPEVDEVRKEIRMEPTPVRKGIPLAIWVSRLDNYKDKIAIVSILPDIAQEHPQIGVIPAHPKPNGLKETSNFIAEILGGDI